MDLILSVADTLILDSIWSKLVPSPEHATIATPFTAPLNETAISWKTLLLSPPKSTAAISAWPRDYLPRQMISVCTITMIGIILLYFLFASFSYYFVFNHEMMKHPRFLKNQVRLEIQTSLKAFPGMTLLTLPWFMAEVRGYSRLYTSVDEYGWTYFFLSIPLFLFFTDYLVYWIHRLLHYPILYKTFHKPHHKWLIPTPYASHAFHPVDGYFQSIPYHLFIEIFPMHRILFLVLFVGVNCWSIFIHDSDMVTGHWAEYFINGPAHHTLHHLYFTCNYGQYFTWADRVGGSFRQPDPALDPLLEVQEAERQRKLDEKLGLKQD